MTSVKLPGLRTEPYASFLSALGVLRLVAEQADATALGWWQGGHFHLQTSLGEDALLDFFCQRYAPTPIASPWNGGSGFYPGDDMSARQALQASRHRRFAAYRDTLTVIARVLQDQGLECKPTLAQKRVLLQSLAAQLPPQGLRWLQAVVTLHRDQPVYSALYFSGGNDGKFEMSRVFLDSLGSIFFPAREANVGARPALRAALLDQPSASLTVQTLGALDPGSTRSSCGSSRGRSRALSNPWTCLLALEGLLLVSPKQLVPHACWEAGASLIPGEGKRRDISLPLWSQPRTLPQVTALLGEQPGPSQLHKQFAVLPRNGQSHFILAVATRQGVDPWGAMGAWLQQRQMPPVRSLEQLGQLRLACRPWKGDAAAEGLQGFPFLPDLVRDDGSAELRLALSLASLGHQLSPPLRVRPQLRHWGGRDLCEKLLLLARRRQALGCQVSKLPTRSGGPYFNCPFWSARPCSPGDIRAFLADQVDQRRLELLLHALCLLDRLPSIGANPESATLLPLPYRLIKLAFHQHGNDRRPAPLHVLGHLQAERWQEALDQTRHFLLPRHPELPCFPAMPLRVSGTRLAAALLFPISKEVYQSFLASLTNRVSL